MKFNINDTVRVKLTDYGRSCLRKNTDDLNKLIQERSGAVGISHHPPKEDADGWSEWQLWCLMRDLGPYIQHGGQQPFELVIEIPDATAARS